MNTQKSYRTMKVYQMNSTPTMLNYNLFQNDLNMGRQFDFCIMETIAQV